MLTTRCPVCFTSFRVTQDQIDARDGKVRCGRCTALFDARTALSAGIDAAEAAPSAPAATKQRSSAASPSSAAGIDPKPARPAAKASSGAKTSDLASPRRPNNGPGLAFPRAVRSSPIRRGRGFALALLSLLLVGQIAFYFRGEIALLTPQLKPALKGLCSRLGCDLPLPRHAELMSIESSDLRADTNNPTVMVLSATLRNRAAFPQAHPALELTLTDVRDQALARRVLTARQYLGAGTNVESGFAPNSELSVKVFIEAAKLGAAGYRLYLFYP